MSEGWLPSLVVAAWLVPLAILARKQSGTWVMPGSFFSLVWTGYALGPMLAAPDYPLHPWAVCYILLSCVLVYFGCLLGANILPRIGSKTPNSCSTILGAYARLGRPRRLAEMSCLVLICVILGLLSVTIVVWSTGASLLSLVSMEGLFSLESHLSIGRYSQTYVEPALSQWLLAFIYAAPLFGGLLFCLGSSKYHRFVALLSLMPGLFSALVHTTRTSFFFAGAFWISSYLSVVVLRKKGNVPLFTRRTVLVCVIFVPIVVAGMVFIMMGRGKVFEIDQNVSFFSLKLRGDSLGHLAAFSQWFPTITGLDMTPGLGVFSFGGLASWLGLEPGTRIPFGREVELGDAQSTNLVTLFALIIADFTWIGALLVVLVGGIIAGQAYFWVARGKITYLPLLSAFYAVALLSFATNVFIYNSTILAWLIFAGYIVATRILPRKS